MLQSKKGRVYALIAVICFSIIAEYSIIDVGRMLIDDSGFSSYSYRPIINIVMLLGFAVTLFIKNVKAFAFVAGANALRTIYNLIGYLDAPRVLYCISAGALFAVVLFALKRSAAVKKIWVVPGAVLTLCYLVYWIQLFIDYPDMRFYMGTALSMLADAAEIVAFVFAGLWSKESAFPSAAEPINE